MKKLFGTDGIRGIVNEELTVDLALKVGNAVGRMYSGIYKKVLIGRDTRNSGLMLERVLTAGLLSAGLNVQSCGVISTPALAYLTKKEKALGIMITASHNPAIYNGIKVLAEGFKIPDEDEIDLENLILDKDLEYVPYGDIGKEVKDDLVDEYIKYIKSKFSHLSSNLKIAVDVGNGAVGIIAEKLFEKMNLNVDIYFNEPNGYNINDHCGSTYPETLKRIIVENGYDLGFLFDGDGDRCLIIDNKGNLIDGDQIMAINALKMKKENRLNNNIVVATIMSNLGLEIFLKNIEVKLIRTQVGDKYVLDKMKEIHANLGGEQSGHIIFLDDSTTGDGIITMLETLDTIQKLKKNIEELILQIPKFPQKLKSVPVRDKKGIMKNEELIRKIEKYSSFENFRLVVRPSGTEHKIRIMAEGKDEKLVEEVVDELSQMIELIDKGEL